MFEPWTLTLGQADSIAPADDGGGGAPAGNPPAPDSTPDAVTGDQGGGNGEVTEQQQDEQADQKGEGSGLPFDPIVIVMLVLVVFWVLIFSGKGREKKKRAALIEQLSKNVQVQTIGGIIGTVVEVNEKDVLVKVDEASNTRMRFAKGAIQQVLSDTEEK
ncbi:MAG: preprotein translocase subunit YajC [Planctomycetaceae bacterium]|nr:preprotein translocase subunit YajC [Planctomycetaceae bacterium]